MVSIVIIYPGFVGLTIFVGRFEFIIELFGGRFLLIWLIIITPVGEVYKILRSARDPFLVAT